jgi:hypothetical protein
MLVSLQQRYYDHSIRNPSPQSRILVEPPKLSIPPPPLPLYQYNSPSVPTHAAITAHLGHSVIAALPLLSVLLPGMYTSHS